jgi:hypothetical protein
LWDRETHPDVTNIANYEIVRVTARSGDNITVTRAQEGTTATSKAVGSIAYLGVTAKTISDLDVSVASAKTTPVDADKFSIWNSVGGLLESVTWANIKATLKTYFDTIYVPLTLRFEKHTGFHSENDPHNKKIIPSYDVTTKKVTLTRADGTFQGYFLGEPIVGLTNNWVSDAIPTATPTGLWFLYHNGTAYVWSQTVFLFSYIQIAYCYFRADGTFLFCGKETHGFMPWLSHEEAHKLLGCYSNSGNGVSGYTLNSTTEAHRRPTFDAGELADEDNWGDVLAMSSNYTNAWIDSAGNITSSVANADILTLNGATPYINVITGGLGTQVAMTNNNYSAIFVYKQLVGGDANSQRYRTVCLQPQIQGSLATIQALTSNSANINGLLGIAPEMVFTNKIIVFMTGNNWQLYSVENISGSRLSQVSSVGSSNVNELNVTMTPRTILTGITLQGNADIIESLTTKNVISNATSGTITLAKQTVTTLTTTLTNAHTLTIIPELPTVFTTRNYQELFLTVGATAPSITWSAPTDVTFKWSAPLGEPTTGLKINTMHSLFFNWQSETYCIIKRQEL